MNHPPQCFSCLMHKDRDEQRIINNWTVSFFSGLNEMKKKKDQKKKEKQQKAAVTTCDGRLRVLFKAVLQYDRSENDRATIYKVERRQEPLKSL